MATQAQKIRKLALGETALGESNPEVKVAINRGFSANVNGLVVEGNPSFDLWAKAGRSLLVIEKGAQFAIGDYLNWGEAKFGEKASQQIDPTEGWKESTIRVYRWVAMRIAPEDRRMDRLTFAHHQEVAALATDKQRYWLEQAAADGEDDAWTVQRMKKAMQAGGDLPVTAYWVLVAATDEQHQKTLMDTFSLQGLNCKALERRAKKPQEPEAQAVAESA